MDQKYVATVEFTVHPHDIITVDHFRTAVFNRFEGTPIEITSLVIDPEDG